MSNLLLSQEVWRERIAAVLPGLDLEWPGRGPNPIEAELEHRAIAGASVSKCLSPPVQVERNPASDLGYLLVQHVRGSGRYSQGHDETVDAGDLILLDSSRPFRVSHPDAIHLLIWIIPRTELGPMLLRPGAACARPVSGAGGAGALLAHYARGLAAQAGALNVAEQGGLLMHLCGLAAHATSHDTPQAKKLDGPAARAAERQRILSYMEAYWRDPRLSAERAARDLNMSRRRLYDLLAEGGIRFSAWVTRRRLEQCRRLLADPACAHVSVAELALSCGFNDVSTFYRRYRRQYGVAPRRTPRSRR